MTDNSTANGSKYKIAKPSNITYLGVLFSFLCSHHWHETSLQPNNTPSSRKYKHLSMTLRIIVKLRWRTIKTRPSETNEIMYNLKQRDQRSQCRTGIGWRHTCTPFGYRAEKYSTGAHPRQISWSVDPARRNSKFGVPEETRGVRFRSLPSFIWTGLFIMHLWMDMYSLELAHKVECTTTNFT